LDIYWERSHDPQSYTVQIQIWLSLGAGLADGEGGIVKTITYDDSLYCLVPIDPDRKRLDAGLAAYEDSISYKMYDCYLAMTKPMTVPPPSTQEVNK